MVLISSECAAMSPASPQGPRYPRIGSATELTPLPQPISPAARARRPWRARPKPSRSICATAASAPTATPAFCSARSSMIPSWPGLQATYRTAASTDEQRLVAIAFAQEAKLHEGRKPRPILNGRDGAAVADFFAANFVHTKGPAAGRAFELEDWQRAFVDEFYKRDEEGRRIYRLGVLGVPRGNGKSPLAAGLGLYELLTRRDSPDVFCAAGSREQARIVFNFAR